MIFVSEAIFCLATSNSFIGHKKKVFRLNSRLILRLIRKFVVVAFVVAADVVPDAVVVVMLLLVLLL